MFDNILYEDNHLLMVEKPINVPVQEDNSRDQDLLSILKNYIKVQYNKPGNVYLGLVHRLDRPVGGAIVFAKTSKAASRLSNELRKQKLYRTYLAIIHGVPSKKKVNFVIIYGKIEIKTLYMWLIPRKKKLKRQF